jgi:hypothetical protein
MDLFSNMATALQNIFRCLVSRVQTIKCGTNNCAVEQKAVESEDITLDDNRGIFEDLKGGKYDSCVLVRGLNWVASLLFHAHASCHQGRSC